MRKHDTHPSSSYPLDAMTESRSSNEALYLASSFSRCLERSDLEIVQLADELGRKWGQDE